MKSFLFFIVFASLALSSFGQEWKSLGTDELFELAKTEAFDGSRKSAREKLNYILENSPNYADVRILLGRTYAWDSEYSKAKKEFRTVLHITPDYQDALNALIDALMWGEEYQEGLKTANLALTYHPNFEDFLFKKASLQKNLEQYNDAVVTINTLLELNPASSRGKELFESIKTAKQRYSVNYRIGGDYFNRNTNQYAFYSSLQLGRRNNWGSSFARINFARRFQTSGVQGEIDLYPSIANGLYAYVNYGFSSTDLFPNHRFGIELYKSLPKSFEASLGLRHLIFSSSSKVTIYTGSVGWYHKNMWFSLRPFITPDKRAGTSFSISAMTRRYFSSPDTFIGLSAGFGYSPDIRTIQSSDGFATDQLFTLRSQRAGISLQKQFKYNWIGSIDFDIAHQELAYDLNNYMWIYSLAGNIIYRF